MSLSDKVEIPLILVLMIVFFFGFLSAGFILL